MLRETRLHAFMLTEDIDSPLRLVEAGYRIVSDPFIISCELAPVTLAALCTQRLRWAQGWFQVSLKHFKLGLRSRRLSLRQKLGVFHLMVWLEIYPFISVQIFPIMAYWAWISGGLDKLDWLVPFFVLTTLFTLSTGPGQTLFAYHLAVPDVRRHKGWFFFYLFVSTVFFTPLKNLLSVVAQIKELVRERHWKVSPRPAAKST